MINEPKTFESLESDSNCGCNLSLNKSSNFYCNCSLIKLGLLHLVKQGTPSKIHTYIKVYWENRGGKPFQNIVREHELTRDIIGVLLSYVLYCYFDNK